jgi:hypothetical protein
MANKKFTTALYGSLKRLVWADHFYDGDLSFLNNSFDSPEKVLEYLPVYEYMFNQNNKFYIGDLYPEDINDYQYNHSYDLVQKYLKPNPYYREKYITSSWILASDNKSNKDPAYLKKVLQVKAELIDVIDLGDSRNFDNISEIIRKIKIIQQSKCYIGSYGSWENITRIYNKPIAVLYPT